MARVSGHHRSAQRGSGPAPWLHPRICTFFLLMACTRRMALTTYSPLIWMSWVVWCGIVTEQNGMPRAVNARSCPGKDSSGSARVGGTSSTGWRPADRRLSVQRRLARSAAAGTLRGGPAAVLDADLATAGAAPESAPLAATTATASSVRTSPRRTG